MQQDNTFATPITPAPTIPPVQDGGAIPQQPPANPALVEPIPQSDTIVMPDLVPQTNEPASLPEPPSIYSEVASKINEAKNVLIALSSDPSVDELAAAIGISLYLDRLGKRATAIYSGSTPNALEFLKPEETFETSADTLQDFVIALNKEKADHLRYKIDGEFVKIYITPYRHRLSEGDLEFSYGDYNVDLVIALDVANGIDLDSALREHGRIMHDAVIINVTTSNPGKFGEIEWSDKEASSVSEMIATLLYKYGGENPIAKDEATAYLTGIVAATNRFANAKTTPSTMRLCSKLMESGANQQLISKNITPDTDNELFNLSAIDKITTGKEKSSKENDPTKLDIEHEYDPKYKANLDEESSDASTEPAVEKPDEIDAEVTKKEHTLLDDLKAAEQSLTEASAETVSDDNSTALEINSNSTAPDESLELSTEKEPSTSSLSIDEPPSEELPNLDTTADEPGIPQVESEPLANPALAVAPEVADAPEINGVPEMNYGMDSNDSILPPPPAPPVDFSEQTTDMTPGIPTINPSTIEQPSSISTSDTSPLGASPTMEPMMPEVNPITPELNAPIGNSTVSEPEPPVGGAPTTPLGPQPAMQDQVYRPQATDPSAFQIPNIPIQNTPNQN